MSLHYSSTSIGLWQDVTKPGSALREAEVKESALQAS